ncbi:MAG: small subunit ribosomal protein S17 [Elusimicrobia bacterium]|nr:MAG: small subunit ribosomal protein S17 [Elusimicrobiota bacterium]KAF0157500.1 MAG: small subunit ribosomal protein S17 [Elusimicrobiota bacterium]
MTENTDTRNRRKAIRGVVVSDRMEKTRVISAERVFRHATYGKTVRRSSKFYAHDEANESKAGDLVEIVSTRPMSRLKRWRVARILQKAAN